MSTGRLHAEFISSGDRSVLVTARLVDGASACVLVAPAFAEEMNKSRRMIAELAAALALRGLSTIVVDLLGTGDSEGEFAEASLGQWLCDVEAAAGWCTARGMVVHGLLGVRFGSLLLCELARRGSLQGQRVVFWQPVLDGVRMIDQFLRLRVAATMIGEGARETVAGLRSQLADRNIEVAGYELTGPLVSAIDGLRLDAAATRGLGPVDWIEVLRSADAPVGAASMRVVEAMRSAGGKVTVQTTVGDPFWTSTEIVTCAELIEKTADALCESA